jgi:hypothetical protein
MFTQLTERVNLHSTGIIEKNLWGQPPIFVKKYLKNQVSVVISYITGKTNDPGNIFLH